MSTREDEPAAELRPPAPNSGGLVSLTRIRSGGIRLIRSRKSRIWLVLAIAGPGVVAANAGNDAAGIATYASAGSQFVYRTLFFMVLVTIALVLVQEMAVRLGTHTGKGLAALIREEFTLRMTAIALGCVLLANTGLVVSEFAGIGAAFELLGVSRYIIIPIAAVAIWALVLFGSYRYAERIFLILSLAFLAYPIAAVLGHPDWGQVGLNLVVPHFEFSKSYLLLGVALIGTTVSPYMQLYAAAGVVDKGADAADYPRARIDAISGAVFACIVSITIIIATAAAIGGTGPLTSAAEAALASTFTSLTMKGLSAAWAGAATARRGRARRTTIEKRRRMTDLSGRAGTIKPAPRLRKRGNNSHQSRRRGLAPSPGPA